MNMVLPDNKLYTIDKHEVQIQNHGREAWILLVMDSGSQGNSKSQKIH